MSASANRPAAGPLVPAAAPAARSKPSLANLSRDTRIASPSVTLVCFIALLCVVTGVGLNPAFGSFGTFSLAFLSAAAAVYFLAFRLYHRTFFLFGSLAWLANAVYILMEEHPHAGLRTFETEHVYPYLSSLVGLFLLYLASYDLRFQPRRLDDWLGAVPGLLGWGTFLLLGYACLDWFRALGPAPRFKLLAFPGVVCHAYVLGRTALRINRMSNQETLDFIRGETSVGLSDAILEVPLSDTVGSFLRIARKLMFLSFIAYAGLQAVYLWHVELSEEGSGFWWRVPFVLALDFKIVNVVAVGFLLVADYEQFAEQVRTRSAAETLGLLIGKMGHDIRSPLTTIGGKMRRLKGRFAADPPVLNVLEEIDKELERVQAAVEEVEGMREDREFYIQHSQRRDLREVVRAAERAVKQAMDLGRVRMVVDEGLPVLVPVYRARLITALVNLINNAVESCQARRGGDGGLVRVICREDRTAGLALVMIRDNGVGIPKEEQHKLFRPFYTTKKSASGRQNRGLGLFSAKRIVGFHGGDLTWESDLDTGGNAYTEMRIALPLARGRKPGG